MTSNGFEDRVEMSDLMKKGLRHVHPSMLDFVRLVEMSDLMKKGLRLNLNRDDLSLWSRND